MIGQQSDVFRQTDTHKETDTERDTKTETNSEIVTYTGEEDTHDASESCRQRHSSE